MSHINDALKKAQEEKDSIYGKYGRIISASSHGKVTKKRKLFAFSLIASIVLLVSFFFLTRYETDPTDAGGDRLVSIEKAVPDEVSSQREEKTPSPKISKKPIDTEVLYQKALGHQQKNDLGRAERLYRNVLNQDPEFVSALNNLGVIYMGTNRDEEAKAMFEKAIQYSEDYVDPYYNLACIYSKRDDLPKSLDYLKKAVQLNNSVKKWIKSDKDLENLSYLEEFKEITE